MNGSPQEKVNDLLASRARKATGSTEEMPSGSRYPELVQFMLIRYAREETIAYRYETLSNYTQALQKDEFYYE